jgi:NAD(P)H-nitrite reductase large subunit
MTPRHEKHKVVCECLGVTEARIVSVIRDEGLTTLKQVRSCTEAGDGCTACHPAIREHLARAARARMAEGAAALPAESYRSSSPSLAAE